MTKSRYRLLGPNRAGETPQYATIWTGDEFPSEDICENFTARVRASQAEERGPFRQDVGDYILAQQKKKIGWKTLTTISIFD